MKTMIQKNLYLLLFMSLFLACSKDKDDNAGKEAQEEYLKMTMNGQEWNADDSFQLDFVESGDIDQDGYYPLVLYASQANKDLEFHIVINLPAAKRSAPLGTFPILYDGGANTAAFYYRETNKEGLYISRYSNEPPDGGIVTITEYEKGDSAFPQRKIHRLKGTFSGTVWEIVLGNKTGKKLEIKNGEFDILNALHQLGK